MPNLWSGVVTGDTPAKPAVRVRIDRVNALIGMTIETCEMVSILQRLQCTVISEGASLLGGGGEPVDWALAEVAPRTQTASIDDPSRAKFFMNFPLILRPSKQLFNHRFSKLSAD